MYQHSFFSFLLIHSIKNLFLTWAPWIDVKAIDLTHLLNHFCRCDGEQDSLAVKVRSDWAALPPVWFQLAG